MQFTGPDMEMQWNKGRSPFSGQRRYTMIDSVTPSMGMDNTIQVALEVSDKSCAVDTLLEERRSRLIS